MKGFNVYFVGQNRPGVVRGLQPPPHGRVEQENQAGRARHATLQNRARRLRKRRSGQKNNKHLTCFNQTPLNIK